MVHYTESTNVSPPLTGGQLDIYRKQASFKIQNMRIAIEDPERTAIKVSKSNYFIQFILAKDRKYFQVILQFIWLVFRQLKIILQI